MHSHAGAWERGMLLRGNLVLPFPYAFPRGSVGTRDAGAWERASRDSVVWSRRVRLGMGLLLLGKAQQQIAVILVLLLAQLDFAGQAFADGVGEGVEFIENGDDAGLFI